MRKKFSSNWKSSKKPRKQRKYVYNAPLHIKKKFLSAHLSKELRKKYNKRNAVLRKGDKIKVMRGKFKKHTGTVEEINMSKKRIYVTGVELTKKDGTKARIQLEASNLMITELNLNDRKRKEIVERKK